MTLGFKSNLQEIANIPATVESKEFGLQSEWFFFLAENRCTLKAQLFSQLKKKKVLLNSIEDPLDLHLHCRRLLLFKILTIKLQLQRVKYCLHAYRSG